MLRHVKQNYRVSLAVSTAHFNPMASKPGVLQHHIRLGQLYHQKFHFSKACFHYQQALSIKEQLPEVHRDLAMIWQEWGDWDLAAQHYQAALALQPRLLSAYFNLGLISTQQHRYGLAAACYQQVIENQPDHLSAHLNLGAVFVQQKQYEEAIAFYQSALARFPANARLRNNLGQTLHQQGDIVGALRQYQLALTLDPSMAKAHSNIAQLWWQHQDLATAVSHYREVLALHSSPQSLGNLASVARAQADFETVIVALRQAVATMPALIEAYCQAVEASSRGLIKVRSLCASLFRTLQNVSRSSSEMTQEAAQWLFQIYLENGAIAYESEAFHRAETLYECALALQPQNSELYGRLANCLAKQGRLVAAKAIVRLGESFSPPSSAITFELSTPAPRHSAANPTTTSCSVTCDRCMGELIDQFQPRPVAARVFQIEPVASSQFPLPTPDVQIFPQGRVWASPRQSDWVACHEVTVTDSTDQILSSGSRQYPWKLPNCPAPQANRSMRFDRSALPPMKTLAGTAVVLSTLSGHVFYHWMIDLLPRLGLMQQKGIKIQQIDHFIVNSLDHEFQRETLEKLGVPLDRVIESDRHPHLQAEQLIVPSFPGHLDWIPPQTIDFLRSQFLPPSQTPKATQRPTPQRIYISRQSARYRRILNHAEVEAVLARLGFITVVLEELTVTQQAQLFSQAEVIVAPHGSGLTNLVFCQSGAQVIELFAPRYIRTDYWMVSQYLKLHHSYIVGRSIDCAPLQELMYQSPLTEDIYVELNSLRSALRLSGLSYSTA